MLISNQTIFLNIPWNNISSKNIIGNAILMFWYEYFKNYSEKSNIFQESFFIRFSVCYMAAVGSWSAIFCCSFGELRR